MTVDEEMEQLESEVRAQIAKLGSLSDRGFADAVRAFERKHPDVRAWSLWVNAVRLELDLRTLLKR
jgi:hypothetical protein